MAQTQMVEGKWEEIVARDGDKLAGREVQDYFDQDNGTTDGHSPLDAAIARLNTRTPAEIAAARNRVLAASPKPLPIPEGKTLSDMIMGKWPGTETDEQINTALERLS